MAASGPGNTQNADPFNAMAEEHLQDIALCEVLTHPGKMIFKRDDEDHCVYWLLEGTVDLLDKDFNVTQRTAGGRAVKAPSTTPTRTR